MPFDPENPKHLQRLQDAVDWSYKRMEGARNQRLMGIKEYVGRRYLDHQDVDLPSTPISLISLFVDTLCRYLSSDNPRVLCTTRNQSLRAQAMRFELALNDVARELELGRVFAMCAKEALFGMGVLKLGINLAGSTEIEGDTFFTDEPYIRNVSLDNFVFDMAAENIEDAQFVGDTYRVSFEQIMDSPLFDETLRGELASDEKDWRNEDGNENASAISLSGGERPFELTELMTLRDIWLPRERLLLTVPVQGRFSPIRAVEWDGPQSGPYHFLFFERVPGNPLPAAPVNSIIDLHRMCNQQWIKSGFQAGSQKTIVTATGAATKDAERIRTAPDLTVLSVSNNDAIVERKFGGMDPTGLAFFLRAMDLFKWSSGNLDAIAGLGPQSGTAKQDELLQAAASRRIQGYQQAFYKCVHDVMRDFGWYEWTDPTRKRTLIRKIEGTNIEVPIEWSAETRKGDFLDFDLDIEPYSMQYRSPQERLQGIMGWYQQILMPAMPMMQQQGIGFDFEKFNGIGARLMNEPLLHEALIYTGGSLQAEPSMDGGRDYIPKMASQTTRRYERVGRSAPQEGKDENLIRMLQMASDNNG